MEISYELNRAIDVNAFISLLERSGLAARRPVSDRDCLAQMLINSNLTVTAWCGDKLVGVARSVTDFAYACYLSDLAVDQDFAKRGIGLELQRLTQAQLGPQAKLILLAAPAANDYYPRIGYRHNPRCWVLEQSDKLSR